MRLERNGVWGERRLEERRLERDGVWGERKKKELEGRCLPPGQRLEINQRSLAPGIDHAVVGRVGGVVSSLDVGLGELLVESRAIGLRRGRANVLSVRVHDGVRGYTGPRQGGGKVWRGRGKRKETKEKLG